MRPSLALRLTLVPIAAALLCGCGSGEDRPDELAGMIPPNPVGSLVVADLAELRERAGLPEDADPSDGLADGEPAEQRFAFNAAAAMPHLTDPRDLPIGEALDESRVQAAASSGFWGPESITVVSSDQPFEEVATVLEAAGYARDGDVLESDRAALLVTYPVVAGGEDEVIAMGSSRDAVEAALERDGAPDGRPAELLEQLGEAPAVSLLARIANPLGCLEAVAIADQVEGGEGELLLSIEGGADPALFLLDRAAGVRGLSPAASFEFAEPEAKGDLLRVSFRYPLEEPGAPLALLGEDVPGSTVYACRGAGGD